MLMIEKCYLSRQIRNETARAGVVAHTALEWLKQEENQESEANLGYPVSSGQPGL